MTWNKTLLLQGMWKEMNERTEMMVSLQGEEKKREKRKTRNSFTFGLLPTCLMYLPFWQDPVYTGLAQKC